MKCVPNCTAASLCLYEDPNCWVLEGHISDNLDVLDHCSQFLPITGRMALMLTSTAQTRWNEIITDSVKNTPATALRHVRWRKGPREGRVWARPMAEVNQAKARATLARAERRRALPPEGRLEISFAGSAGADPQGVLTHIAYNAGQLIGRDLLLGGIGEEVEQGFWTPIPDHLGRLQGRLAIGLRDRQEVLMFAQLFYAQFSITIDGERKALRLHSPYVDAARLARAWGAAPA